MPIAKDSPLRMLPANLDRKQALFFDGIRVAAEMTEGAYFRLEHVLMRAATNETPEDEMTSLVPLCFLDAWAIVDSVNRLRVLLKQLPKFKQRAPSLQVFYRATEGVVSLRNSVQHLDTEISRLAKDNLSVWGTLTWVVLVDEHSGTFKLGTLISGAQYGGMHALPNPVGHPIHSEVDLISLTAGGNEVNLSEIVRSVVAFIKKLEGVLAPQFSGQPLAPSDFLILADFIVGPPIEHTKTEQA